MTVPDDQPSVQDGVDAAASGDQICVKASGGPYVEQVVINKDLTLKGIDDPTIQAPSDPGDFTIPESAGNTWEPVVFAFGGTESGGDVSGSGIVDVSITGLTIDGRGDADSGPRYPGILFRNVESSKGITGNVVEDMGVGGRETFGILAYGNSEVTIAENDVSEYERGGIGANGDQGTHPAPDVTIKNNEVTGSTGITEAWGPNGIQIGFGATGKIVGNTVKDNRYSASSSVASGILVFGSSEVQTRGNTVKNADVGIASAVGTNNKIVRNEVIDANFGTILLQVKNTKLGNNEFSAPSSDLGAIGIWNFGTNNKLINNSISGFATKISDSGDETKIAANDAGYTP